MVKLGYKNYIKIYFGDIGTQAMNRYNTDKPKSIVKVLKYLKKAMF